MRMNRHGIPGGCLIPSPNGFSTNSSFGLYASGSYSPGFGAAGCGVANCCAKNAAIAASTCSLCPPVSAKIQVIW